MLTGYLRGFRTADLVEGLGGAYSIHGAWSLALSVARDLTRLPQTDPFAVSS